MTALTREQLLARHATALPADAVLDPAAVERQLAELPDWTREGDEIVRSFRHPDFHATMAFVEALAAMIHREDHHPELRVSYGACQVRYATHRPRGLTINDFIGAARADAIYAAQAGSDRNAPPVS